MDITCITKIKAELLEEYTQEGHSEQEIESFLLGMVRLESAMLDNMNTGRLNDFVDNQAIIHKLEEKISQLTLQNEKLTHKRQKLKNQNENLLQLDKNGRSMLRKEAEYIRIEKELSMMKKRNESIMKTLIELQAK